jgi:hypothetical protein
MWGSTIAIYLFSVVDNIYAAMNIVEIIKKDFDIYLTIYYFIKEKNYGNY